MKEELQLLQIPEVQPSRDSEKKALLELEAGASTPLLRRKARIAREILEELVKAEGVLRQHYDDITGTLSQIIQFHNAHDLWEGIETVRKGSSSKTRAGFLTDTTLGFLYCCVDEARRYIRRSRGFSKASAERARAKLTAALRKVSSQLVNTRYSQLEYSQSDILEILRQEFFSVQVDGVRRAHGARFTTPRVQQILDESALNLAHQLPRLLNAIAVRVDHSEIRESGIGPPKLRAPYLIHLVVNRRNFLRKYGRALDKANVALTRAVCPGCPDIAANHVGSHIRSTTIGRRKKAKLN